MSWVLTDVEAAGVRAERDAGNDVAEDQRLAEPLGGQAAQERGNHDHDDVGRDAHGAPAVLFRP